MLIKTTSGVELGGCASSNSAKSALAYVEAGTTYQIEFCFKCSLNSGIYFLNAGLVGDVNGSETYLHRLVDVAMFRVLSETDNLGNGIIDFNCVPEIKLISSFR
jgi:lipopolysaccharide transport system ATP-binding protein